MGVAKSTAERVLDAAEALFAEKGYAATSLGEVADQVGIRSPSLYNHFRNKEALYLAVVDRLLDRFVPVVTELRQDVVTRRRVVDWLRKLVALHLEYPNLARLLQHAALSGGPGTEEIVNRMFRPMFETDPSVKTSEQIKRLDISDPMMQPWAVMAMNNMVMSYITMAPIYQSLLGLDLFSEQAKDRQMQTILRLTAASLLYDGRDLLDDDLVVA